VGPDCIDDLDARLIAPAAFDSSRSM